MKKLLFIRYPISLTENSAQEYISEKEKRPCITIGPPEDIMKMM